MLNLLSKIVHFLLDPSLYAYLGIALIIFRIFKKKDLTKPVTYLFIYLFILTCPMIYWPLSFLENHFQPQTSSENLQGAQAIMVLGGGVTHLDKKSHQFLILGSAFSRPLESLLLAKRLNNLPLIISGGIPTKNEEELLSEAQTIEKLAMAMGISGASIVLSPESGNTYEEAKNVKQYLIKNQLHKIILVTSALHMLRSSKVFQKQGIEVIPYPVDFIVNSKQNKWKFDGNNIGYWNQLLHEVVGLAYYKLIGHI